MVNEELIFGFVLWGFILGKLIPLKVDSYRKWWYNRRGIPYFMIYMIDGNKIIDKFMIKQIIDTFNFKKGKYITKVWNILTQSYYSPTIDLNGEKSMFYYKGDTNPLEFKERQIKPAHNDPEVFKTIIEDNSIAQALSGEIDITGLKRYILLSIIIAVACIAGIMYFLMRM